MSNPNPFEEKLKKRFILGQALIVLKDIEREIYEYKNTSVEDEVNTAINSMKYILSSCSLDKFLKQDIKNDMCGYFVDWSNHT